MDDATIDWLIGKVLESLARNQPITPAALTFLLRRYATTGAEAFSGALGPALAAALEGAADVEDPRERSEWLTLFVEAAAISEDDRLRDAAADLVCSTAPGVARSGRAGTGRPVGRRLPERRERPSGSGSIHASWCRPPSTSSSTWFALSISRAAASRTRSANPRERAALFGDHVATASALLTAYAITGRLPYSMLAEELMQFAQRTSPEPGASELERFITRSEAARVLCRLAKLHEDADYRQVAVIAVSSDYAGDAKRTLADLARTYADHGADAAIFGIALGELRDLTMKLLIADFRLQIELQNY